MPTLDLLTSVEFVINRYQTLVGAIVALGGLYYLNGQLKVLEMQADIFRSQNAERRAAAQIDLDEFLILLQKYHLWADLDRTPHWLNENSYQFPGPIAPPFDPINFDPALKKSVLSASAVVAEDYVGAIRIAIDRMGAWRKVYIEYADAGYPALDFHAFENETDYLRHDLRRRMSAALQAVIDSSIELTPILPGYRSRKI
jgi:hypothetical protein